MGRQQIVKTERLPGEPSIVRLRGRGTEIVAGPGDVTGLALYILAGGPILPGIQPGVEKCVLFVLRIGGVLRIALQKREGGIGVFLLQIRGDNPADCPVRHRVLRCRKILILADDPRIISMGVQRAEPVYTRKDDIFRRLRLAFPARKQNVVTIQRRLRKLQALLFCSAWHIGKANPFGGGVTLKTATLRRGQRHPL